MSDERWKCPKCGTENDAENAFCGECGTKKPEAGIGMAGKAVPKPKELPKSGKEERVFERKESNIGKTEKKKGGKRKILFILLGFFALAVIVVAVLVSKELDRMRYHKKLLRLEIDAAQIEVQRQNEIRKQWKNKSTLYWSNRADGYGMGLNWWDAVDYCKNLNEGGYTDWLLPTISELRTLIKNCPYTEINNGQCRVRDNCLESGCRNDCAGCKSSPGDYNIFGDRNSFWSSSILSDRSDSYDLWVWYVDFDNGRVDSSFVYDMNTTSMSVRYVRCVR